MVLNLVPLLPEIFLSIVSMGLLIVGVNRGNESTRTICWAACLSLFLAILIVMQMSWGEEVTVGDMFKFDQFSGFMRVLILLGMIASLSLAVKHIHQENMARFEYPVLIMLAGIGMLLMVSANNLLALYMALELQSLSLYILASLKRNSLFSSEAGVKYFSLGALSSGLLLFGISLIYGFTGSVDFEVIGTAALSMEAGASAHHFYGIVFGLVFILAGLAFKISAVPFHMWTPDVYQGTPANVTAFFAIVPKIAAMGLLMRLVLEPFASLGHEWGQILYFLSVASMIVGAFAALAQENIKRLLAYSSIGNMGYALIGLVTGTAEGAAAVLIYLMIYMVMTAGVFAIVLSMRRNGLALENISNLSGLSQTHPVLAYSMAVLMFSLSGIPPLAGFFGKLIVFKAAVAGGFYILAVLGVLTSVVAAYYYLRVIKVMFFDSSEDGFDGEIPFSRRAVLMISVVFALVFVLTPSAIIDVAQGAAQSLF